MRITTRLVAILAAVSLAGACGDDDDGATPDAMVNNNPDAAPTPDAPPSAACDATGDYTEGNEAGNDPFSAGAAETSGQTSTLADTYSVAGCIDPGQANANYTDFDAFIFTVGGTDPVWVTLDLTSPEGAAADGTEVWISADTAMPDSALASATFADGTAILPPTRLAPGEYALAVLNADTTLSSAFGYVINFSAVTCTSLAGGTADHVEANDGAESRGNDVATMDLTGDALVLDPTADANDAPEATGLTLTAGMSYLITGNTADVAALDSYLDRDTFAFSTGADVDRAAVLLEWTDNTAPDDMDMDWLLFPADDVSPTSAQFGWFIAVEDEAGGALVAPESDYWLWTGLYNDAPTIPEAGEDYSITVCLY